MNRDIEKNEEKSLLNSAFAGLFGMSNDEIHKRIMKPSTDNDRNKKDTIGKISISAALVSAFEDYK